MLLLIYHFDSGLQLESCFISDIMMRYSLLNNIRQNNCGRVPPLIGANFKISMLASVLMFFNMMGIISTHRP